MFCTTNPGFKADELRKIPIQVTLNPKAIFPYPMELPQNLQWSSEFFGDHPEVHPLLKAAWDSAYYVSIIHPFQDGNERVSRILFTPNSHRFNGMIPVICSKGRSRAVYLETIVQAISGNPLPWC
ncbi:fic DOC family [Pyrenophora seminiperda CCB06]|uniref:Fic DOC family n=1 Tax=Pyrenophora seminiperda CCB06 TaxID=1302712 RepID=A0A3M7MED8_9PLEO|nr:fic DOC family [Pyrenophora seminiperda CCB06]